MTDIKVTAGGAVLPPGSFQALEKPEGKLVVTIAQVMPENPEGCKPALDKDGNELPVSQYLMVDCAYPHGAVKSHQVLDVNELGEKVSRNLMTLYGLSEVVFAKTPSGLTVEQTFEVGE